MDNFIEIIAQDVDVLAMARPFVLASRAYASPSWAIFADAWRSSYSAPSVRGARRAG
jgi:hypothetical protein